MQVQFHSRFFQSVGKRFDISHRVDAFFSSAVFLVSLTLYSWHWLATQPDIDHDASRLGMHAVDLLEEGVIPFYIYHQYAAHPFIVYLHSLAFAVFGYSDVVVQGVTVVGSALAPPAIYWASLWLFQDQGRIFARRAGLTAALGLALSTIFAFLSQSGNETTLLPVFELAGVAFLWRGFRRGRKLDYVLAGLMVGVSQYVYIAALFFPVVLAIACAGAILGEPAASGTLARIGMGGRLCGHYCVAPMDSVCILSLHHFGACLRSLGNFGGTVCIWAVGSRCRCRIQTHKSVIGVVLLLE